ncbi:(methyl)glyoxal oxidase [Malassezia cuniculi]|uniref:(Methyl)glyoxal oxidase n=1 Tax=Malassezia cuniculi TaxID=948313 RepID=A0AAF0EVV7_9BASI|nr:(methyl)glyoxal oxidase [Malassezia cuniculi]
MLFARSWWRVAGIAIAGLASSCAANGDDKSLQYEVVVQDSLASAMMLALANEDTAFILDKAENNRKRINNKPVWATLVNLTDFSVRGIESNTNPFCAAGGTLGNGTWVVAGGNQPVSYGGAASPYGQNAYDVADGRQSIRLMEPTSDSSKLEWIDDANSTNKMDSPRWYPAIEVLADGSIVLIGGATNGGFVNRNTPNLDPLYATSGGNPVAGQWDQGGANPSFEFWPTDNKPKPQVSEFMKRTSGLNMYAHTYLMPSGKIFMQANYSTTLWDYMQNTEEDLPDMPGQITRVYPASAATAMKPLTPQNNYTPSILFCGGSYMTDEQWGNYTAPNTNTFEIEASKSCVSIEPETADGKTRSNVQYEDEDDLPEGRSMGQFIHLPNGKMVIVNGARMGVAGYGNTTWNTIQVDGKQVLLEGLAQEPTYRPVVYDPEKPKGKRLEYKNYGSSKIARLYHSSAILIPDGSVLVAGSNPHQDVAIDQPADTKNKYKAYNTTYVLERWYPDYFFKERPNPQGLPSVIKYGGSTFNFTMDAAYMGNAVNDLANKTKIMVIRPGFSTHAMNMGQRSLQLDHTFQVKDDGSVEYMVNPMPTNMNIFVPGPAILFVSINGVPSKGKLVSIGGAPKDVGRVPFQLKPGSELKVLPRGQTNSRFTGKAGSLGNTEGGDSSSLSGGAIAGIVIGVIAAVLILLAILLFLIRRNRRRGPGWSDKQTAPLNNRGPVGSTTAAANVPPSRGSGYSTVPATATHGSELSSAGMYNMTEMNSRSNLQDTTTGVQEPYSDHSTTYLSHPVVERGDIEAPASAGYSLPQTTSSQSSTINAVKVPASETQHSLPRAEPPVNTYATTTTTAPRADPPVQTYSSAGARFEPGGHTHHHSATAHAKPAAHVASAVPMHAHHAHHAHHTAAPHAQPAAHVSSTNAAHAQPTTIVYNNPPVHAQPATVVYSTTPAHAQSTNHAYTASAAPRAEPTAHTYSVPASRAESTTHTTFSTPARPDPSSNAYNHSSAMSSNHSTYHSAYHSVAHSDLGSDHSQSALSHVPFVTSESGTVSQSGSMPYLQREPGNRSSGGIMGPRAMPASNLQLHLQQNHHH